ncbi:MAG: 2-C-methyl-D-erythritol 4-phosphate cytidylyltransferase [Nitrosomonas sp.]|uniref:2-C-methyl-D-erythritol 4-phosphate cytidylyltransferase n=1 Tax=Nitrosomonas sp. TaxID=42353 RepID=UPI002722F2FD|nr:2-C-methyl-D-erythritol 4-phosphate cytidylyltransferase [Nitrosomonas sp.]MDO9470846.1 2-C-methyl-D-erythritol 4-phosphate cytidylyltransferase [Nitrosomonas sp.]MDP1786226.1 2-C-methyl-D-erythritol 4-phosphate cytidylyltransferase [Nitrosomonas sp.]MDP3281928.1 2-C-methyl-D-erythritol 4-phosphate cytidylyltransferase [Nitrosomonas sp.]
MSKFFALIPAAGSGARMGNELPKQYLSLNSRPMIYHAIYTLCQNQFIAGVFVILAPSDSEWFKYDWSEFSEKLVVLSCGGLTRADSVLNGLTAAKQKNLVDSNDWILVHDAARPCLTSIQLDKLINELSIDEVGGLLAVPVADTLKRSNIENRVTHTESRENLWQAQTPQMFRYDLLTHALRSTTNINVTDDASAVEALGFQPKLVLGDAYNFKVTYPQDLALAELILQKRNNS